MYVHEQTRLFQVFDKVSNLIDRAGLSIQEDSRTLSPHCPYPEIRGLVDHHSQHIQQLHRSRLQAPELIDRINAAVELLLLRLILHNLSFNSRQAPLFRSLFFQLNLDSCNLAAQNPVRNTHGEGRNQQGSPKG